MLVHVRNRRVASWALLALPFLVVIYCFPLVRLPRDLNLSSTFNRSSKDVDQPQLVLPSQDLVVFWRQLLSAMMRTRPQIPPIEIKHPVGDREIDPNAPNREGRRPDRIEMMDWDLAAMKRSHSEYTTQARQLAPRLPYQKGSKGIVMTAGGPYFGIAVTSLLMLRRTGTQLPVQLFLDSGKDYNEEICENVLPSLGAECIIMEKLWEATPGMPKLEKFQFKVFAILFSSYQEVLFLDADCWPVRKPDYLFTSEPYHSRGLVTWPDFWLSTSSRLFYDIADIQMPAQGKRRSTESGILLYNKDKQALSLLFSAYYNFYGPKHYYPLLSQGATGQGDKETFLHGALVAGTSFYDVKTHIGILGRWINGTFESAAMTQADPEEDYAMTLNPKKLMMNQQKYGKEDKNPNELHAKWLFIHHNLVKIDVRRLGHSLEEKLFQTNLTGHYQRLWGDGMMLSEMAGYDVEREMWNVLLKADCESTLLSDDCDRLKDWYRTVFT
jgi:alpha 1,2-mannosyltransferase